MIIKRNIIFVKYDTGIHKLTWKFVNLIGLEIYAGHISRDCLR